MPYVDVRGVRYYYEEHGKGKHTLVFAHGFLMDGSMFMHQLRELSKDYRVITFDWKGQGRSSPAPSGYDMDELYEDAKELLRFFGCEGTPCHWIGLSMGGFVGIRLASRNPELLKSLVLSNTSAGAESFAKKLRWGALALIFLLFGVRPVEKAVLKVLFSEDALKDPERRKVALEYARKWRKLDRRATYKLAWAIFNRRSVEDELGNIRIPVLILAGEKDVARPIHESLRMHELIPNSKLVIVKGAGHSIPLEQPEVFTKHIREFVESLNL